ncbi:dynein axonemal assembly factor 11 [Pholidichthys leucotaenia]
MEHFFGVPSMFRTSAAPACFTEELVRRRAEHNDGEIFSLEELSLHQQDIERIEHLDRWCRDLRILYLHNNLIPRIENLGRLKKLEYVNLALNNIEVIENLEGCESLQKLDLTVNFVGRLSSVESLRHNVHLRELFLVGNPCSQFEFYREFVVSALPQLKCLDGTDVSRTERIRASQGLEEATRRVWEEEEEYLIKRVHEREEEQRRRHQERKSATFCDIKNTIPVEENKEREENGRSSGSDEERLEREFWETPCPFTPESRLDAYRHLQKVKASKKGMDECTGSMFAFWCGCGARGEAVVFLCREKQTVPEALRRLTTTTGRVLNINEPKLNFTLTEDEGNNCVVLDLGVYRHMDTSLLDVDVQPWYVRVSVKGKIFQLVLPAEVKPDSSTAQRSQTTGNLLLTMPRARGEIKVTKTVPPPVRARHNKCSSSPEDNKR